MSTGERFMELADLYLMQFPVGTQYSVEKFDKWAFKLDDDELRLPYLAKKPGEKGWGTHLQNRHNLKRKINEGGRCGQRDAEEMFQVMCGDKWTTRSLVDHTSDLAKTLSERSHTTMKTRLRQIFKLAESPQELPEPMRAILDQFKDDLESCKDQYDFAALQLVKRLNSGTAKIRATLIAMEQKGEDVEPYREILAQASIIPPKPLGQLLSFSQGKRRRGG